MSLDKIRIVQTGSPIRRHRSQRATLIGLGLNKIGRISEVPFTPQTWGMIRKVEHLVRLVDEAEFAEHQLPPPRVVDEEADIERMRKVLFAPRGIRMERIKAGQEQGRKSPDFELHKGGKLCGYCELKSTGDDWLLERPKNIPPGEIHVERRRNPAPFRLAQYIEKAAKQFDALNPDHASPNILVIVSHTPLRRPVDLRDVLEGMKLPDGRRELFLIDENLKTEKERRQKQKAVWDAARRIDAIVWIDALKGTCEIRTVNGALRLKEACDLLGVRPD